MTRRSLLLQAAHARLEITDVKAAPLRVRPGPRRKLGGDHDPERWRDFGPFSQLDGAILVRIRTKQGLTGYGMGGGGTAACLVIQQHLSHLLQGADAGNIELLWDQLFSSSSFYGRRGIALQAISGIDLALWDLAGRRANLPVHRLLGGPTAEKIPGYYTGNDLETGLRLGFRAFKISGFQSFRHGAAGFEANVKKILDARQTLGPDRHLMLDALCAWDVDYTIELAQRVAAARLWFLEEPLLPDDIEGYERLCREIKTTRIASGEHESSIHGFRELIRHKAVQVVQPDLTWSGGLTDARRVLAAAETAGIPFIPHRGGSVYGITALLLAKSPVFAESFGTGQSGSEVMERLTPRFENGFYYPPTGAGFGVDFDAAFLAKYAPELAA